MWSKKATKDTIDEFFDAVDSLVIATGKLILEMKRTDIAGTTDAMTELVKELEKSLKRMEKATRVAK